MGAQDQKHRSHLPMPNTAKKGLVTYDAKDPAWRVPPIERVRPPEGAPNVLIVLIDDVGFGASSAFGGPCQTPIGREAGIGRAEVQPVPHHRPVLADSPGAADGPQPSFGRHGGHHRDRDRRARLFLGTAQHHVAARADPEAQRLLDRAVRKVPRGAGVGDEPGWAVRRLADGRRRLRVFLRIHRRRGQPVVSDALRGHDSGRAGEDARRGLSPHGGHDRQGDRLDRPAEEPGAGQAVLRLLRARSDARAASRAEGMGRQVQGQVRQGLGHAARGNLRPAEEARGHPQGTPS